MGDVDGARGTRCQACVECSKALPRQATRRRRYCGPQCGAKDYYRRHATALRQRRVRAPRPTECEACGKRLRQKPRGRPRLYCSRRCLNWSTWRRYYARLQQARA